MANEANATSEGVTSSDGDVHRLRDILVEEVSLVDRAANKRRFLVVKRSNEMPDDGKRRGPRKADDQAAGAAARGRGKKKPKPDQEVDKARRRAASTAEDDDMEKARGSRRPPWEKDDDEDTKKARGSRPPWEKDDDEDTEKADDEDEEDEDTEKADDEDEEDEDTEKADDEDEEDEDTKKADEDEDDDEDTKKADDEDDEDDEDDASTGRARSRAKAAKAGRRGKPAEKAEDDLVLPAGVKNALLRVLSQALERLMGVANRVKESDAPDDETEVNVPDDLAGELDDIGELLEDVAERFPTGKAASAKAGVAKAGRRMAKDRLDRFQKALALLSDVLKELTNAHQPPEPTGGVAEHKAQKRTTTPGIGALAASVSELTQIMKGQQDELTRLRKTRATSNAIAVDGGRTRASQDVSWPLDMNRPISRDSVSKTVSFYDAQ